LVVGAEHMSTFDTVNNLGNPYADQSKLVEAKQMYERALRGCEKMLGADNITTNAPALNPVCGFSALSSNVKPML
jgi:hypothetical protein